MSAAAASGETVADDESELALDTYFSNCLTPVLVETTHGALKRKGCYLAAA